MASRRSQWHRYRTLYVIPAMIALILAWRAVQMSGGAYLTTVAPEWTLRIRPHDPRALIAVVDAALNGPGDAKASVPNTSSRDLDDLKRKLHIAILREPLNARAHRLLGQLAEAQGDRAAAKRSMKMAARLSPNESFAINWLMLESLSDKQFAEAAEYADLLLRTQPQLLSRVAPILGRMAESEAQPAVISLLRQNPPWRGAFFRSLDGWISLARTPAELFIALKGSDAPPTKAEINPFINLLLRQKRYDLAYQTWMQFLEPDRREAAGYLFNGGFQWEPDGSPFDWQLSSGNGLIAQLEKRSEHDATRALSIRLGPGRVESPGVRQLTLLPPGLYRFAGSYRGEVTGPRGVEWTAKCVEQPRPIAASEMFYGSVAEWRRFEFEFSVPAKDCSAVWLTAAVAARSPSEQLVSGSIWFDELTIERVGD